MDSFVNLAYLGLLAFGVINGLIFLSRLGASRSAWSELVQSSKPVRRLTAAERAAIKKAWNTEPLDDLVYRVSGPVKRHGIESNRGSEWHLLVGDIEVMPFPEWPLRVTESNDLEVVRAKRKRVGLPVTFNGVALEDALAQKAAGKGVEVRLLSAQDLEESYSRELGQEAVADDETPELLPTPPLAVVERGSRMETAQEVALRQASQWHGTASAVFAMLGLLGVLFTVTFDGATQWLGLLPAALAIGCGWLLTSRWTKGPKPRTARRLRTLTGPTSLSIVSVGEGAAAGTAARVTMGDNVLIYPPSWRSLPIIDNAVHEVEVDTFGEVVQLDHLSLFEQLTRFTPVASWRSAVLAGGAGMVLLVALAFGAADPGELKSAMQRLSGHSRDLLAESPAGLLGLSPKVGDWVNLSGTASCLQQVGQSPRITKQVLEGDTFDCPLLGWGPQQSLAAAENADTPAEISGLIQLASGLLEWARQQNADPYTGYGQSADGGSDAAVRLVQMLNMARSVAIDLNPTVLWVEKLCGKDGGMNCARLEAQLLSAADLGNSWAAVVQQAQAGKLPTQFDFRSTNVRRLADTIIAVVRPAFVSDLQKGMDSAWKDNAVLLVLDVARNPVEVVGSGKVSDDPLQRAAAIDFALTGTVRGMRQEGGHTVLDIQRRDTRASTWRLLGPAVLALLALLIGAFGLFDFLRTRRVNLARQEGLADWLSNKLR